jgi:hypothetical protein
MGEPRSPHDREDLIDTFASTPAGSKERLGPILSALGLVGWLMIGLILRLIWSRYDGTTDVLLLQGITSSLASVLVLLGGGAASLTLSVVGGLVCGTRIFVKRVVDRWSIFGVIASLLGFAPIVLFVVKLLTA